MSAVICCDLLANVNLIFEVPASINIHAFMKADSKYMYLFVYVIFVLSLSLIFICIFHLFLFLFFCTCIARVPWEDSLMTTWFPQPLAFGLFLLLGAILTRYL